VGVSVSVAVLAGVGPRILEVGRAEDEVILSGGGVDVDRHAAVAVCRAQSLRVVNELLISAVDVRELPRRRRGSPTAGGRRTRAARVSLAAQSRVFSSKHDRVSWSLHYSS